MTAFSNKLTLFITYLCHLKLKYKKVSLLSARFVVLRKRWIAKVSFMQSVPEDIL